MAYDCRVQPLSKRILSCLPLKSLTRLRDHLVRMRSFYLVKIINVLDHTFPEFKPFFKDHFSKTSIYLLENCGSAKKMASTNSASYEKLRSLSHGKFTPQHFLALKSVASNTVGVSNDILEAELKCLLTLHKGIAEQISMLEPQITELILHRCLFMLGLSA